MVKLEELTETQKGEYRSLKRVCHFWEGGQIGRVIETQGDRSISADYKKGEIILYKPIDESIPDIVMIQKPTEEGLGKMHVAPRSYVEEITEQ